MSLKEIQTKLLQWETSDNPLASLTSNQREAILDLESLLLGIPPEYKQVSIWKSSPAVIYYKTH